MSKLDLIRAGHTEVADGQCGLCDVPWPCDVGKVLAEVERCYRVIRDSDTARIKMNHARIEAEEKLAAAEARAEQAERERDASVKARMDWQADYDREKRQHHARLDALRERLAVAEELADQRMRHRTEQLRVNKRLRERLATVEAALIRLRAGCMVSAGTACRLCHGTWLREDGETAADHHDGCPLRETAPGAALDATPANDEIVLPELETRMGVGAVVSVSVRPRPLARGQAAIPAAGEVE